MNNKFIILVTQRNAEPFIKKCLDSILSQTYKNYEVIIMDDASTDKTMEIVRKYPFQCIHNNVKHPYHCINFMAGINLVATDKEDIIILLSGDDWFYSDDVLEYLNGIYQEDIWLTYGNFVPSGGAYGPYCQPIPNTREYRRSDLWVASHLVTCKKKLWDRIKHEDLLMDGHYPNNSFDCAFLYPMIEMAGYKHLKFIEKVLYVYNDNNPVAIENFKKDKRACLRERKYWKAKPSYPELKEL